MKYLTSAALAFSMCLFLPGCEVGGTPRDGGGLDGAGTDGRVTDRDAAFFDPFDPMNACGVSTIPTSQIPGSLLIVFDRSGSMSDPPGDPMGTGPSKWSLATSGINSALAAVSDELSAGILFFSDDGGCGVDPTPAVPIAPLSTNRALISSALAAESPGGNTPAFAGLLAGYDYLDTLSTPGQRGIVLVTDGGETCDADMADSVMARVQTEHDAKARLTFAVGMDFSDNNLSTIAFNGGTPRNTTCLPMCASDSCLDDGDCPGAAVCVEPFGISGAGFCNCATSADCISPQTCEAGLTPPMPPFPNPCDIVPALCEASCQGDANCCHFNAAAADFQTEFEAALDVIARRLLDSCVFDVPNTAPEFTPTEVNVGVTFAGEERTVLRRSDDSSTNSWKYVPPGTDTLIIQGPICERLLAGEDAVVEIVLGCDTLI